MPNLKKAHQSTDSLSTAADDNRGDNSILPTHSASGVKSDARRRSATRVGVIDRILNARRAKSRAVEASAQSQQAIQKARSRRRRRLLSALSLALVLLVLYGELLAPYISVWMCKWPDQPQWNGQSDSHILLIADPQLTDKYQSQYNGFSLPAFQYHSDLYMRRAFRAIQEWRKPDAYLFMGNLMHGGAQLDELEWERELLRFQKIFPADNGDSPPPRYFLGGTHDYGAGGRLNVQSRERFKRVFGNPVIDAVSPPGWTNHVIVGIDSAIAGHAGMPRDDVDREILTLIDHYKTGNSTARLPRVVLSHLPLSRPSGTGCSPILPRAGYSSGIEMDIRDGYPTMMDPEWTNMIMDAIKPDLVLSGDHHLYCRYVYADWNNTEEHTIGTFSFLQDAVYPQFGMLSLYNPSASVRARDSPPTTAVAPCQLPIQYMIIGLYASYVPVACVLTGIITWVYRDVAYMANPEAGMNEQRRPSSAGATESEWRRKWKLFKEVTFGYADHASKWTWAREFLFEFSLIIAAGGVVYGAVHLVWACM